MKLRHKSVAMGLVLLAALSTATTAFAIKIKRPSENGDNSNALQWLLLGKAVHTTVNHNGKSVVVTSEIVCPSQDVEAVVTSHTPVASLSGSCDSGEYLYIYQFQSTSTNVTLKFKNLGLFNDSDPSLDYGVVLCDGDPQGNTLELCTNDPTGSNLPAITATQVGAHAVNFVVPNFPAFPAGTPQQGQGLTLFILTKQNAPLPVHLLLLGIE